LSVHEIMQVDVWLAALRALRHLVPRSVGTAPMIRGSGRHRIRSARASRPGRLGRVVRSSGHVVPLPAIRHRRRTAHRWSVVVEPPAAAGSPRCSHPAVVAGAGSRGAATRACPGRSLHPWVPPASDQDGGTSLRPDVPRFVDRSAA
jgi:hypothetical protein